MQLPAVLKRHQWKRDANGQIDEFAYDGDNHAGPQCEICFDCFCKYCHPLRWAQMRAGEDPAECAMGRWIRAQSPALRADGLSRDRGLVGVLLPSDSALLS